MKTHVISNLKKLATILPVALLLVLTSAAQDEAVMSDWDKNSDKMLTRSEFVEFFKANFTDDWNVVDDPGLDDENFFRATYNVWDRNKDERLSREEWDMAYDLSIDDYTTIGFDVVDLDGDTLVDFTEYHQALDETEYFTSIDLQRDNILTQLELARMVFNTWDFDNSNFIEENEFQQFIEHFSNKEE